MQRILLGINHIDEIGQPHGKKAEHTAGHNADDDERRKALRGTMDLPVYFLVQRGLKIDSADPEGG